MLKTILCIITFLLLIHSAFAETCPNPIDIANNQLDTWQPIDRDNGTSISGNRFATFLKEAKQLKFVEWMEDAPEGAAHCYYSKNFTDDYLDIYLAKEQLIPDTEQDGWRRVTPSVLQCNPLTGKCLFKQKALNG